MDNITIILFAIIIIIVNVYTRPAFISSDRKVYTTLNQHNNICPALYIYIYTIQLIIMQYTLPVVNIMRI